jgi:hypothetical protein
MFGATPLGVTAFAADEIASCSWSFGTWGQGSWGNGCVANIPVTGLSSTGDIGSVSFGSSTEVATTGVFGEGLVGSPTVEVQVFASSSFVSSGKSETNAVAQANADATVTGLSCTASLGDVSSSARVGVVINANVNLESIQAVGNVEKVLVWSDINSDQTPSWAEIEPSQTPDWIEIAA